jgi:hypothetical protein
MNVKERKGARTTLDLQYRFVWKQSIPIKVLCGDVALRLRDQIRELPLIVVSQNS